MEVPGLHWLACNCKACTREAMLLLTRGYLWKASAAFTNFMHMGGSTPRIASRAAGRAHRPSPAIKPVAAAGMRWTAWLEPLSIHACLTILPTQKSTAMKAPTAKNLYFSECIRTAAGLRDAGHWVPSARSEAHYRGSISVL